MNVPPYAGSATAQHIGAVFPLLPQQQQLEYQSFTTPQGTACYGHVATPPMGGQGPAPPQPNVPSPYQAYDPTMPVPQHQYYPPPQQQEQQQPAHTTFPEQHYYPAPHQQQLYPQCHTQQQQQCNTTAEHQPYCPQLRRESSELSASSTQELRSFSSGGVSPAHGHSPGPKHPFHHHHRQQQQQQPYGDSELEFATASTTSSLPSSILSDAFDSGKDLLQPQEQQHEGRSRGPSQPWVCEPGVIFEVAAPRNKVMPFASAALPDPVIYYVPSDRVLVTKGSDFYLSVLRREGVKPRMTMQSCFHFNQYGNCTLGTNCKFVHVLPRERCSPST